MWKNMYNENDKTLLKEIKEDLNKQQIDVQIQSYPNQNPGMFFVEIDNCNLKFTCKCNALEKPKHL